MNVYFEMMKTPIFSVDDLSKYYSNYESARSAVKSLLKKGLAVKIRNNMYTCISGETNAPIANRFQIASKITPSSFVSHHTAFEFYGLMNQVYYDVYVSSQSFFRDFEFDGYYYHCIKTDNDREIEKPEYSGGIRVSSFERTVVDSIKDLNRIAGIEELFEILQICPRVNEEKLKTYLSSYENQFLWQKTGFILSKFKEKLGISNEFLEICREKAGRSHRYISPGIYDGKYDSNWQLVLSEKTLNYLDSEISNEKV